MNMQLRLWTASIALCSLLLPFVARATTVDPVSFEEMVRSSQRIFVGEVISVQSFRADAAGALRIRTRVTFRAGESLLGAGPLVVLEFRGGTVGDLTEQIAGMPEFAVGDQYVVFAHDGGQWVSPLVGFSQGLFRVSRDARDGTSRVLGYDGTPIASTSAVGRSAARVSAAITIPMPLSAFVQAIEAELAKNPHR